MNFNSQSISNDEIRKKKLNKKKKLNQPGFLVKPAIHVIKVR